MSNEIKINIAATDDGSIDNLTNKTKKLNKELNTAQTSAKNIRAAGSTSAVASAKAQEELTSYGVARGTVGTGASSRDFAKQAQGLGGLVHVYATFAANIFAVTAAFNALSKAQDLVVMQDAARILSSSYGVSLNNLSKQIKAATDNAVSLKTALQFANLGSTAGLQTKQMSDLAKVAKSASIALGRDMEDSLNRVFKGALKVEPELLDELGLIVKVDEANKDYARTLNKSVGALTSFERSQAFVNATIDQGRKKYKDLDEVAVNGFSRFAASITDLGQGTLGVINKYLNPLMNILAESPTALALGISLVVKTLVSQAIPALKNMNVQWIENLRRQEESTKARIALIEKEKELKIASLHEVYKVESEQLSKSVQNTKKTLSTAIGKGTEIQKAVDNFLSDPTNKASQDLAADKLNKEIKKTETRIKNLLDKVDIASAKGTEVTVRGKPVDEFIRSQEDRIKKMKETVQNLAATAVAANAHADAVVNSLNKDPSIIKEEETLRKTQRVLKKNDIMSSALQYTEADGMLAGFRKLKEGINEAGTSLTAFDKIRVGVSGGIKILTAGFAALASTVMFWASMLQLATLAVESGLRALKMFDDTSSKASMAADALGSSVETLSDSMSRLSKSGNISDIFKFDTAVKTGILETVASINELKDAYETFNSSEKGSSNRFFDKIQGIFGFGTTSNTIEKAAQAALQLSKAGVGGISREEATNKLKEMGYSEAYYGSNKSDTQVVKSYIELSKNTTKAISEVTKVDQVRLKEIENQRNASISTKAALEELNKSTADYINSLTSMTPLTKAAAQVFTLFGNAFSAESTAALYTATSGLNSNVEAMSGQKVPIEVTEALQNIKLTEQALDKNNISGEERNKALNAANEAFLGKNTVAQSRLIEYTTKVGDTFINLSRQSADLSVAQAALSKRLRMLGTVEGVIGKSGTTETMRMNIENAQKSNEIGVINTELSMIKSLINNYTGGVKVGGKALSGDSLSASSEVSSRIKELSNITNRSADDQKELENLQKVFGNIVGLVTKEYDLTSRIKVLKLSMSTADEIKLAALQAEGAYTSNNLKMQKDYEITKERINQNTLEQQAKEYPTSARLFEIDREISAEKIKQLEFDKEAIDLKDKADRLSSDAYIRIQELIAQGSKALEAQRDTELGKLAIQQKSLEERRAESKTISESNKKLLEQKKHQEEIAIQIRTQSNIRSAVDSKSSMLSSSSSDKLKNEATTLSTIQKIHSLRLKELEIEKEKILLDKDGLSLAEHQSKVLLEEANYRKEVEDAMYRQLDLQKKLADEGKNTMSRGDMIGLEADRRAKDFRNSMKSSIDYTFDAVYAGIDAGIDDIMTKLQRGEKIVFSDVISLIRNGMSDVFRDAAKEYMKAGVRDLVSGLFNGPKTYEAIMTSLTTRIALATEKTAGIGGLGNYDTSSNSNVSSNSADYLTAKGLSEAGTDLKDVAKQQGSSASTFLEGVKGFGSSIVDFVTGSGKASDILMAGVSMFKNMIPSFLLGIFNTIASAMSVSSTSSGGGGGIFGFIGGLFGGSDASGQVASGGTNILADTPQLVTTALAAKGGLFPGHLGLSAHSNSIVTSPTTFAFAKGGIPSHRGLMGEAGPEAILPLKRDATGNLGVRSTGASSNNFEINITIEDNGKGSTREQETAASNMPKLGDAIKQVILQELIKQQRPGGLLAAR